MKKTTLTVVCGLFMGLAGITTNAALVNGSILTINTSTNGSGTVQPTNGSYFSVATPVVFYVRIEQGADGGLILGSTQDSTGGHLGLPTTADTGGIDKGWDFFFNTGVHFTTNPTNVLSASANTATIDFSGWRISWADTPVITLGGGIQSDPGMPVYNNGTGIATVTCGVDCDDGDIYTLDYAAVVPANDPSGFGGVAYTLHLEGTIKVVPVPAAIWLLGSGLMGLVGIARCKKVKK